MTQLDAFKFSNLDADEQARRIAFIFYRADEDVASVKHESGYLHTVSLFLKTYLGNPAIFKPEAANLLEGAFLKYPLLTPDFVISCDRIVKNSTLSILERERESGCFVSYTDWISGLLCCGNPRNEFTRINYRSVYGYKGSNRQNTDKVKTTEDELLFVSTSVVPETTMKQLGAVVRG